MIFTAAQQALVDSWLASEADDIQEIDDAIAIVLAEKTNVELEDSIYVAVQSEAMAEQVLLLTAKAVELESADPTNGERTVEFLPGHPSQGGEDPSAWEIFYMALDPVTLIETKVIEYSHAVNFDNDAALLDVEYIWLTFQGWRTNVSFGTLPRLSGLDNAVATLQTKRAAILARNEILRRP